MNDTKRISILCDNTSSSPEYGHGWGFSAAIETGDDFWLWDTGASGLFLKNAEKMGIDPGRANGLALSHGHYDHTGGIPALLEQTAFNGPIVCHPEINRDCYSISAGRPVRSIGAPKKIKKFKAVNDVAELAPGLTMLTDINREPGLFQAVKDFYLDPEGKTHDPTNDDAFLVLDTAKGPVVILGCCHSGLMNSLKHMREKLGIDKIFALLGGMHLFKADEKAWEESARAIEEFDAQEAYPGHCTGQPASDFLKKRLSCKVADLGSGLKLEF